MLSQGAIASTWGPRCYKGPKLAIRLNGAGVVTVRAQIADAVLALDACLRAHAYRTRKADTGALVCRQKVNGAGMSNHSYGTANDINWGTNPYGRRLRTDMPMAMVKAICSIRTRTGAQVWNWGGFWTGNKDAMHFEIVCTPRDIASGIDPRTVPGAPPAAKPTTPATPAPVAEEEDEMVIYQQAFGTGVAVTSEARVLRRLTSEELAFWEGRIRLRKEAINEREWDMMLLEHSNGQQFKRPNA